MSRTSRVLSYERAVTAARRSFIKHGRLDMQAVADDLAVGRATLYRVVGSRDRLLGDVLWSLSEPTLQEALQSTNAAGVDRIIEIAKRYKELVMGFEPLRIFLRAEPETAFRVLFTPAGGVHERIVGAWKAIFEEASEAGELVLPYDADNLAYVFVRIGESMLYSDLLAGREPDLELAASVQRAILTTA